MSDPGVEQASAAELRALLDRVPSGWTPTTYRGRRWALTRSDHAGGRSLSVFAEELGGPGLVSANVYRTRTGDLLRPCEMPAADVLQFLRGWEPDPAQRGSAEEAAMRSSTPATIRGSGSPSSANSTARVAARDR